MIQRDENVYTKICTQMLIGKHKKGNTTKDPSVYDREEHYGASLHWNTTQQYNKAFIKAALWMDPKWSSVSRKSQGEKTLYIIGFHFL